MAEIVFLNNAVKAVSEISGVNYNYFAEIGSQHGNHTVSIGVLDKKKRSSRLGYGRNDNLIVVASHENLVLVFLLKLILEKKRSRLFA